MRILIAASLATPLLLAGAALADAEKRVFVIANSPSDYGVDRCLADGQACGAAAATAYCQSKDFTTAASYRKADRGEVTGSIAADATCGRGGCGEFVAIECTR